jgi:hypothetical protein
MLNLSSVTLLCIETRDPTLALYAIQKCLEKANFGNIVLITDLAKLSKEPNQVKEIVCVQAPPIKTTKDYSDLLLMGLRQYVSGTHVLIIQWDSFILHPELWTNDFLQYDYIGAVWPHHPNTPVGNGGFSLRSVKLLEVLEGPRVSKRHPEDFCICIDNKAMLESDFGIRFAPTKVAEQFAVERTEWHPAFGFHGFFNFGKVLGPEELSNFIDLLPDAYLGGVDAYDLIDDLILRNQSIAAKAIARRIQFSWKWRMRFIQMKIRMWLS